MKKFFLVLIFSLLCFFCLSGCVSNTEVQSIEQTDSSMFVKVEQTNHWYVVYHKQTKVMYVCSNGGAYGVFTVMLDSNGYPLLWQGE